MTDEPAATFDPSECSGTLFDVRRSVRYHDRRLAHYERLHRLTSLVTILLAGVVLMEVTGAKSDFALGLKFLSAAGAILGACDLVIGFARHADLHRDLKRRFVGLEVQLLRGMSALDAECIRREIEADEPPIYAALDMLSYHELCAASGKTTGYALPTPFQRLTANWFRWPDIGYSVVQLSKTGAKNE